MPLHSKEHTDSGSYTYTAHETSKQIYQLRNNYEGLYTLFKQGKQDYDRILYTSSLKCYLDSYTLYL